MGRANPLFTKLARSIELTDTETDLVSKVPFHLNDLSARQDIVSEGRRPSSCVLLINGLAATSKVTLDGKRQTMALHISGDMPDLLSLHLDQIDSDIRTITPCDVAFFDCSALRILCDSSPRIAAILWRDTLVDASIFREWVVNVGQRPALNRVAHLFCEMMTRMEYVGLAAEGCCELILTQNELADATGLSPVHLNRKLQELRSSNLVSFDGHRLAVHNWHGLVALAGFTDTYLHLSPRLNN